MEYGMDGGVVSQNFILFLTKICEKRYQHEIWGGPHLTQL